MKWILAGKNDAAVECLQHLVDRGDEVWALGIAGDDGNDGWQRSLRAAATRLGVRFQQPRSINAPEVVDGLAAYAADAFISIQYDQILRGPLFERIGCPCLNLHFALLPRHRGVAPIAWAILAGDTEAGVTLHHMLEDIDAGDLVAQRAVPIEPGATARELYDALTVACVELFEECYPFSGELLAARTIQDAGVASYHRQGDLDFSRRRIDWTRRARELHAWVRAMIFPPMQHPETVVRGRPLLVTGLAGRLGEPVDAEPGVVIRSSSQGVEVAASDRSILLTGLTDPADPAARMDEIASTITDGDRLT